MIIESIIRREGGTTVTLGSKSYQFLPDDKGRHVSSVEDPDHIGMLLSIREGYRLVIDEPAQVAAPATVSNPEDPDTLRPAGDESVVVGEGDQGGEGQGEGEGEGECEGGEPDTDEKAGTEADLESMDREELAVEFEKKFGNRPHGRWSAERIRDELKGA